jgi:hypothetical protein
MRSFRQGVKDLVRAFVDAPSPRMLERDAHRRSIQLLKQNLSPAQREQYERRSHFEVIGGCSGNRYRIRHGAVMNVELLNENGRRACLLCFIPEGGVPVGDIMLAQKIALELFETEAFTIANKMSATIELFRCHRIPNTSVSRAVATRW